jgi:hypothetical protein
MSDPLAQRLPAEQHPVILIVRPELAPFLVEFRDVRLEATSSPDWAGSASPSSGDAAQVLSGRDWP